MSVADWFQPVVIDMKPVTNELQTLRDRIREQDAEIARISDLLSASYEGNKKLNDEMARLWEDAARLDWLGTQCDPVIDETHVTNIWVVEGMYKTVREALDAWMSYSLGQEFVDKVTSMHEGIDVIGAAREGAT